MGRQGGWKEECEQTEKHVRIVKQITPAAGGKQGNWRGECQGHRSPSA